MTALLLQVRQRVWGLPAVINFVAGGMGAGAYLTGLAMGSSLQGPPQPVLDITAVVMAGAGFTALAAEAGRPLRGIYLLSNLRRSWMSREAAAAALFIASACLDLLHPLTLFRVTGGAAALYLLISHGLIMGRARAVTAWNVPVMPAVFPTSGVAGGMAVMLVFASAGLFRPDLPALAAGLVLLWLDASVWLIYLFCHDGGDFMKATSRMRLPGSMALEVGLGLVFPIILVTVLIVSDGGMGEAAVRAVCGAAGAAMITGGVSRRAGVILRANYLRPVRSD